MPRSLLSSPFSLSLSLPVSFSRFHAEPSWLNPRLSYFTVKIVECSFRASVPFVQFHAKKMLAVEARPSLSLSLSVRAFSDFLSAILPSEEL